jgi:hypothetical protein
MLYGELVPATACNVVIGCCCSKQDVGHVPFNWNVRNVALSEVCVPLNKTSETERRCAPLILTLRRGMQRSRTLPIYIHI